MMVRMSVFAAAAAMLTTPAWAQADQMAMARAMTSNQLGVLEYCQSQGYADAASVAAERASIARLPPGGDAKSETAAEALGRSGSMSMNGNPMTLTSMASGHNTTVAAMCQQMASSAKQAAAAFSQGGATMQMPAGMPSMSGMPSMPPGMPSMSGMPAMPGTTAPTR